MKFGNSIPPTPKRPHRIVQGLAFGLKSLSFWVLIGGLSPFFSTSARAEESYVGFSFQLLVDPRPGQAFQFSFGPEVRAFMKDTPLQGGTAIRVVMSEDGKVLRTELRPRLLLSRGVVDLSYEPGILVRIAESPADSELSLNDSAKTVSWIQTDSWQPKIQGVSPSKIADTAREIRESLNRNASANPIQIPDSLIQAIEKGVQESLRPPSVPCNEGAPPSEEDIPSFQLKLPSETAPILQPKLNFLQEPLNLYILFPKKQ